MPSTSNVDLWMKDVAPSNELRKWFSSNPERWGEFKKRYKTELKTNPAFGSILKEVKKSDVTLLYSSRRKECNNAVALAEFIKEAIQ